MQPCGFPFTAVAIHCGSLSFIADKTMPVSTMHFFRTVRLSPLALVLFLSACAVGPDYQRPAVDIGEQFLGVRSVGAFDPAVGRVSMAAQGTTGAVPAPADPALRGWVPVQDGHDALESRWWSVFDDATLNQLMTLLNADNLTIAQAEAQYRQAQAALQQSRSGFFPVIGSGASVTRSGRGTDTGGVSANPSNQYSLNGTVSWEPDLWGRVRRTVEGSQAGLQASRADLAAVRLSLQSTLVQTYFRVLGADAERDLLVRTQAAYERSLQTVQNRLQAGIASPADLEVAKTQLENVRSQILAADRERSQLKNALAVLVGKTPAALDVVLAADLPAVPVTPVGVPSTLLQRRPDIVAAERRVAQANAQIGLAQAAWFPDLTLSAQGGYSSGQWAQWLSAPSSFWALGPILAFTIFDGGAREARIQDARAGFDVQVAGYRQTVLDALREVEDYLVGLDLLGQQSVVQARALASARESLRLTQNQYDAGLLDYLSVVQVETSALDAERVAIGLRTDRLLASVQLMAALGGGWTAE